MIIGRQQPFPFLANKQLYAIVLLTTPKGKKKAGIVPCSNDVFQRLIEIPTRPGYFMLSEELILHFIFKLYPKYAVREKSILRVTRNADIDASDIKDEDLDYRDTMEQLIKKRTRLNPVRIELSRSINHKAKKLLSNFLEIGTDHIIEVGTPLDLSFVFELQNMLRDKTALFYQKRIPQPSKEVDVRESIIAQVEQKDVLLSYPYESMKPFIKLLNEAAEDPDVVSIKMTLYRVADRSKIIEALIEAAENGKEVVVLVELRARFDEANNIGMSHRLEDAGCQILYGLGEYKVHSKLCLITKKNGDSFSYITQIGTGNYNEKTSRLYTDLSLMTADQAIGNHDESSGGAVDPISAALIIADKTDVRRNRVREKPKANFDKHDRVNYAVTDAKLKINVEKKTIALNLQIDPKICSMYEYFDIFLGRMMMCRGAADIFDASFKLTANGSKVL